MFESDWLLVTTVIAREIPKGIRRFGYRNYQKREKRNVSRCHKAEGKIFSIDLFKKEEVLQQPNSQI